MARIKNTSRFRTFSITLALIGLTVVGAGCSDAEQGTLLGAGVGALAGQAIGGNTAGTLIGAGVGAGAGYIIGNEQDKKKAEDHRNHDY